MPADTLTAKGRQTREAIELAARKLFAERGFHGTTLADITSAAGKSPAVFYRYYTDKEDLLAALAESFLRDIVTPSGLSLHLPESPDDTEFFSSPASSESCRIEPAVCCVPSLVCSVTSRIRWML